MPGFNQTGPMGQGSMTGRKMGRCTNFGASAKAKTESAEEISNEKAVENLRYRGVGRGHRHGGSGRPGQGLGRQHRFRGNS